jgi:shikimate kinase
VTRQKTVWLVGMMGAGKSAVGRELAGRLGLRFVDTDAEVVAQAGCSVSEIFETRGEGAFRALEREAVDAIAGSEVVVGLGGGAMAQPGLARRLADSGTLVYLRAAPETLLARLGDCAGRPLLAALAPGERATRLRALLEEREPVYEKADLVVDTDALSVEAAAEAVAQRLREC